MRPYELTRQTRQVADAGLGRPVAPPARVSVPLHLRRDGEFWTLNLDNREVRLKNSRGLYYLSVLLREPGREFYVGDLESVASDTTAVSETSLGNADLRVGKPGDSGEWLDARAKADYRKRITELAEALEDAEARDDREAIARIRREREALSGELARVVGLGGRNRKASSASERARVNVQRRIRDVLTRVSEQDAVEPLPSEQQSLKMTLYHAVPRICIRVYRVRRLVQPRPRRGV